MIVLGGPLGANDEALFPFLVDELKLLERRLAAARPTLGICLGAQLVARVLGARVYPAAQKEIGWMPLTLTASGLMSALGGVRAANDLVLHWHGDTFDLPAGARLLASTDICPHQAFDVAHTLALQFHLEADPDQIERWIIGHLHELTSIQVDLAGLRRATGAIATQHRIAFARVFESWLEQIERFTETEAKYGFGS
jgi:GMP synthase (glutamine-hydrolysing)